MALSSFFMCFSWSEPVSIVLVALPVQTSCFLPGSYMSRTRVPTLIVELVHDPVPIPKEEQETFRRLPMARERGRAGQPVGRAAALWRYYCALTAD